MHLDPPGALHTSKLITQSHMTITISTNLTCQCACMLSAIGLLGVQRNMPITMHQQDLACSVYRNIINEVPLVVSFRVKKFHVTHH